VAVSLGGVLFTALLGVAAIAVLAWRGRPRQVPRWLLLDVVLICYVGDFAWQIIQAQSGPLAGPQQVRHPPERRLGVHVVQRGDRGDQVDRCRLEGRGEEVAEKIVDARGPGWARASAMLRSSRSMPVTCGTTLLSRRVSARWPQPTSSACSQPGGMASRIT
jgi:hypothetical protein